MCVLYFILWIVLNGRITLEIVLFGIAISAAISLLVYKLLDYRPQNDIMLLKNLPVLILYALVLIREIFKASFDVMKITVSRSTKPEPVIIEFDSGLESRFCNVLLANSITLTPGTYTLKQNDDHFVIHCLRAEYAEGIEDSVFVQLLRKLR